MSSYLSYQSSIGKRWPDICISVHLMIWVQFYFKKKYIVQLVNFIHTDISTRLVNIQQKSWVLNKCQRWYWKGHAKANIEFFIVQDWSNSEAGTKLCTSIQYGLCWHLCGLLPEDREHREGCLSEWCLCIAPTLVGQSPTGPRGEDGEVTGAVGGIWGDSGGRLLDMVTPDPELSCTQKKK